MPKWINVNDRLPEVGSIIDQILNTERFLTTISYALETSTSRTGCRYPNRLNRPAEKQFQCHWRVLHMGRIKDVPESVNMAIHFIQSYPCTICQYENATTHKCTADVKYKGTCEVYITLKGELLKMRDKEE